MHADVDAIVKAPRIQKPTLIVHGREDTNPATPPTQACLLFQALTANGTRSRLVVLPGEGHGYVGRDGIATALTEQAAWLARWLRPQNDARQRSEGGGAGVEMPTPR